MPSAKDTTTEPDGGTLEENPESYLALHFVHGDEMDTIFLYSPSGEWVKEALNNLKGGSQMSWSVCTSEPDAPWSYTITLAQDPTLQ